MPASREESFSKSISLPVKITPTRTKELRKRFSPFMRLSPTDTLNGRIKTSQKFLISSTYRPHNKPKTPCQSWLITSSRFTYIFCITIPRSSSTCSPSTCFTLISKCSFQSFRSIFTPQTPSTTTGTTLVPKLSTSTPIYLHKLGAESRTNLLRPLLLLQQNSSA